MSDNKIETSYFRSAWANVFGDGDPKATTSQKFTLALMFPKNLDVLASLTDNTVKQKAILRESLATCKDIKEKSMKLAAAKWPNNKWKATRWNPLLDGDEKAENGGWSGYAGFYIIRAKTKYLPTIKDIGGKTFIADGDDDLKTGFYSGCWAMAFIAPFTYAHQANNGVAMSLGTIQKIRNDEPFVSEGDEFTNDGLVDLDDDDMDNSVDMDEEDDDLSDLV